MYTDIRIDTDNPLSHIYMTADFSGWVHALQLKNGGVKIALWTQPIPVKWCSYTSVFTRDPHTYSGWPKVFVKYGVGNMENKNRRQRNADFAYILQRQGKTMISINKITCSHVTIHVIVMSAACLCMFLYAKDHGAERERDVTGLEKGCCRFF